MKTKKSFPRTSLPRIYFLVRERQWAADQEIEETDNGVVIHFSSTQYHKILEWVLSRGCTARPLEPEGQVKDWKRHVAEMGRMTRK
jgi:hypothetical protein